EVVDENLRAPPEQIRQGGASFIGLEPVFLVDPDPRKLLTSPRQLVAAPGQLLLRFKQFEPRREPLFACSSRMLRHHLSLPWSDALERRGVPLVHAAALAYSA